ncbi:MAG TPA: ABC transporter permease, partial [Caulobacteraceae bacterium]
MLADVIRAETAKLLRNRATAFWAFGFVSVLSLILNLVAYFYTRGELPPGVERPVDLAQMTLSGVSQAAGPLTLLFCLMGAATIFAGEYRWETWRLMTPRATRTQLWLGKVVVFAAAVAVSILLLGLASLITGVVQLAMGDAAAPARGELGEYLWRLSSSSLMSWIRILQFGALAA